MTRLIKTPDGVIVDLDDPTQLKTRALKQLAGVGRTDTPSGPSPEVLARANAHESGADDHWWSLGSFGRKLQDNVARPLGHGVFAGFDDEAQGAVSAATSGVYNAIKHGDISEIGKEYTTARDTQREINRRHDESHPILATGAELGGALLNPVGDGAAGLNALAKGADALGLGRAARVAAGGARKIESAYVPVRAALAGANQGALNAAGTADNLSDVPGALADGYLAGGVAGGVLGGAVHGGAKIAQTLRDAGTSAAPRIAAERVGGLLEKGGFTPESAATELASTDAANLSRLNPTQGAMLADLTPGLQAKAANIARQVDVPSSNALITRANERIADRGQQAANQFAGTADNAGGTLAFDAPEHLDSIIGARKGSGRADYAEGGAMDAPLQHSPEIERFFRDMPPSTENAMRAAHNDMAEEMRVSGQALPANQENSIFTHVPNMRTLDYSLRRLSANATAAYKAGDAPLANRLGDQITRLKQIVGDANPDYAGIIATQRTGFEKQRATEIGQTVLKRMMTDPRSVMRDLNALPPEHVNDARIGIVDALINTTRADPVNMFASFTRTPAQKKVLSYALGGDDKLDAFEQYLTREARAASLDKMNAPGRQSVTSTAAMGGGDSDASHATQLAQQAGRGFAFGGVIGAATGGMRYLARLATSNTPAVQEEIAKILLGKGEDLAGRVQDAQAFTRARRGTNTRRAVLTAKAGQQGITDLVGGQ